MSISRRTHLFRGATALLVSVLLALWSAPAHAADEIGFSNDGVTWAPALAQPLFDPEFRWVPGDSRTATFFVRNQGPTSAVMTIEARSADADELLGHDDIHLHARVAGGSWVPLRNGIASASLTDEGFDAGDVVQIEINAAFDPATVNQSQSKSLPLTFEVTLADAASIPAPEGPDSETPGVETPGSGETAAGPARGGVLPSAGAAVGPGLLLAALMLCALGAVMIARRSSDDDARNGATS